VAVATTDDEGHFEVRLTEGTYRFGLLFDCTNESRLGRPIEVRATPEMHLALICRSSTGS